ncbi:MAG: non-canonical purine NTP diphosphatase [Prevotellaceae bacterium]|nr:non-canonical purine NTP diphosphatase [Prevotellaceae bacterium]
MMQKLVFATNNTHKLEEVRFILKDRFTIVGLSDAGCTEDIPETADTLEGNALLKAQYVYEKYGVDCFADDTGLEVAALGGAPGVKSARYAGEEKKSFDNIIKLLHDLKDASDRSARFRTVIALIMDGQVVNFEGSVSGFIAENPRGSSGFGYDPVFVPDGYLSTFAQLAPDEKNKISHRAVAINKLVDYLKNIK